IISTLLDREYTVLDQRRFVPTDLGEVVSKLLVRVFPNIFDVDFTSRMESALDRVEEGEAEWRNLLEGFYPSLQERLREGKEVSDDIVKEILAAEGETCEECGRPMLVKWNRFGRFLGCSGFPECRNTRPLDQPETPDGPLGTDEGSGLPIHLKVGPYGPYLEVGEGEDGQKPRRVSIPEGKPLEEVDLDYARKLLSLPRSLGTDPDTGEEVVAGLGRYGPYVRRGKTFGNLRGEGEMFEIGLREALEIIRQKEKGGRRVLNELGPHPESERDLRVLAGRYGPYVTDGTLNATLPDGTDPEELTVEEAVDLLARKAAKKGRGGRRKGGRKGQRGGRGSRR
ncbi:MAG TPA: topoisomerase C-terminal repeat-containing protein, partial [Longimicrobiales bacterium]|nr:topoisomerase C-terminal repeat-containing protein [Longimicrobiales bacterium]